MTAVPLTVGKLVLEKLSTGLLVISVRLHTILRYLVVRLVHNSPRA